MEGAGGRFAVAAPVNRTIVAKEITMYPVPRGSAALILSLALPATAAPLRPGDPQLQLRLEGLFGQPTTQLGARGGAALGAGFRLAGALPGAESPTDQRDGDHRPRHSQDQAAVRHHPGHGASGDDLELVRSLQLFAIDPLRHQLPPARRAWAAEDHFGTRE